MNRTSKIFALIVASVLTFSCTTYYDQVMTSHDVDFKYKAAFNYFEQEKYRKAGEVFETLKLLCQGTPQEDTVNYYNGLSNFRYGDYITAEANFASFIEVFPRSPFIKEAEFYRIICLFDSTYEYQLDQTPTHKAMSVISEYMYDNPTSEHYAECQKMMNELISRLSKKSFESAKLYYLMEDYKAAHYALKSVLRENSENEFREDILYYTALSSFKYADNSVNTKQRERFLTFVDDYYNFAAEYPESTMLEDLEPLFNRAQRRLGKNVEVAEETTETETI